MKRSLEFDVLNQRESFDEEAFLALPTIKKKLYNSISTEINKYAVKDFWYGKRKGTVYNLTQKVLSPIYNLFVDREAKAKAFLNESALEKDSTYESFLTEQSNLSLEYLKHYMSAHLENTQLSPDSKTFSVEFDKLYHDKRVALHGINSDYFKNKRSISGWFKKKLNLESPEERRTREINAAKEKLIRGRYKNEFEKLSRKYGFSKPSNLVSLEKDYTKMIYFLLDAEKDLDNIEVSRYAYEKYLSGDHGAALRTIKSKRVFD